MFSLFSSTPKATTTVDPSSLHAAPSKAVRCRQPLRRALSSAAAAPSSSSVRTQRRLQFDSDDDDDEYEFLSGVSEAELADLFLTIQTTTKLQLQNWLGGVKKHMFASFHFQRADFPECLRTPSKLCKDDLIVQTAQAGLLKFFVQDAKAGVQVPDLDRALHVFGFRYPEGDEENKASGVPIQPKNQRELQAVRAALPGHTVHPSGTDPKKCILAIQKDGSRCTNNEYKPCLRVCYTHLVMLKLIGNGVSRK